MIKSDVVLQGLWDFHLSVQFDLSGRRIHARGISGPASMYGILFFREAESAIVEELKVELLYVPVSVA